MPMQQPQKKPATRRYVVDRIEEDDRGGKFVVLESQDDGSTMDMPMSKLPSAREGAMFSVPLQNGQPVWSRAQREKTEERSRQADLQKRLQALMNRNP